MSDQKSKRRTFTPEFKAEAVAACRASDRSINQVAKELDVQHQTLKGWLREADASNGHVPSNGSANGNGHALVLSSGPVTDTERDELHDVINALRRENKRLLQERDLLKATVAFFAKEGQ